MLYANVILVPSLRAHVVPHEAFLDADMVIYVDVTRRNPKTGLKTVSYYAFKNRHDRERWLTITEKDAIVAGAEFCIQYL